MGRRFIFIATCACLRAGWGGCDGSIAAPPRLVVRLARAGSCGRAGRVRGSRGVIVQFWSAMPTVRMGPTRYSFINRHPSRLYDSWTRRHTRAIHGVQPRSGNVHRSGAEPSCCYDCGRRVASLVKIHSLAIRGENPHQASLSWAAFWLTAMQTGAHRAASFKARQLKDWERLFMVAVLITAARATPTGRAHCGCGSAG